MGEVVNLRMARKRRDRREDEKRAEANRVLHGLTKAERTKSSTEAARDAQRLDGHRREPADDPAGR